MKISVIIPVYNESIKIRENIEEVKRCFDSLSFNYEIIVIDDGSTDQTIEQLIGYPGIRFSRLQENCGKGVAFRKGVKMADGTRILLIDSDLQIAPKEITHFLKLMDLYDADAVIGDKYHAFGNIRYSFTRRIMSRVYNFINRMLFGIELQDTQCGFKLFKADPLKILLSKFHIRRFAFDIETIVALKENNYRVIDAPVTLFAPRNTRSVSIKTILNVLWDTLKIWIVKKMGYYKIGD